MPYPYPASDRLPDRRNDEAEQLMAWRRGLSDTLLRMLAADYIRGHRDECSIDAFKEYERRFGQHTKIIDPAFRSSKRNRLKRAK